ncbi:hypothetical protein [Aestuariivivens sediminicola]|uniref:hypothetical protein n=1 Tax=Aestuariivivens sediminicola TaxID=2913560 RepID=UPI001F5AE779|nr:hypothetical protein [Aestuariivivens sediminicola]
MKKFLLLLISFTTYFNIQAQEWKLLDDNDEYTLFIRNHSENSAWVKWEYKKLKVSETLFGKEEKIKRVLTLFKFDCSKKQSGIMAKISYDVKGEVLSSEDYSKYYNISEDYNMEHVIPDSIGEWVLFKFCESKE